jgi:hypothetical protein
MTEYEIAVFLHIIGLAAMFGGIGVTVAVLHFANHAKDVASVRTLMAAGRPASIVLPVSSLLVLASGVYMTEDVWGWDTPWIYVSLIAFLVMFAAGPLVNAPRMRAIGMEAGQSEDGAVPDTLRAKIGDPVLTTAEHTMTLATVGIIYLMTTKPDLTESLIVLGVSIMAGLALTSPAWRRPPS